MVPGSFGWGSAVLAATAMLAPSRAARSAIARPMPRLAPVMKRVFPDRLTGPPRSSFPISVPRRGVPPSRPRRLQLEVVAVGVLDIKGAPFTLRAVSRGRLTDVYAPCGEPGDERGLLERCDRHAEMLEVAPRPRRLTRAERPIERHEIDEAPSRTQLRESELRQ